jgi:hypothetical protein
MVSPSNPGDETRGGILSKDFGFRPRMHAREPWRRRGSGGWGWGGGGLKRRDEEFPPGAGRLTGWDGRSQLCVWYDLIIDGQVNVF